MAILAVVLLDAWRALATALRATAGTDVDALLRAPHEPAHHHPRHGHTMRRARCSSRFSPRLIGLRF